jgi:hypothetical protein
MLCFLIINCYYELTIVYWYYCFFIFIRRIQLFFEYKRALKFRFGKYVSIMRQVLD